MILIKRITVTNTKDAEAVPIATPIPIPGKRQFLTLFLVCDLVELKL